MRRTTEIFLSSPEAAVETRLRPGMSSLLVAYEECLIGLEDLDAAALTRTGAALSEGTSKIEAAHELLKQTYG